MLIDLSHTITEGMPVYPGDPPTAVKHIDLGECIITNLNLCTHAGTHIDAPHHFKAGKTVDTMPLSDFCGNACVINDDKEEITEDIVIIKTGWDKKWGTDSYFTDYPRMTIKTAEALISKKVKLVGLDTPSPDTDGNIHKLLLSKGIIIAENLCGLDSLPQKFRFFAVPLKIKDGDGSPVRAFALI